MARGSEKYILDKDHNLVEVDLMTWAHWLEDHRNRRVAETLFGYGTRVSTIFLGIDYRFGLGGPPLVFETMVFDAANHALDQVRYSSWDDAVTGHKVIVRRLSRKVRDARRAEARASAGREG